jgi:hypothetical protein
MKYWLAALLLLGCGHRDNITIASDEPAKSVTPTPAMTTPAEVTEPPKPEATHDGIVPGAVFASAKKVDVVDGRIVLIDATGAKTFVSAGPNDHEPVLAPHRRALAFVRYRPEITDQTSVGDGSPRTDLYVIAAGGAPKRVLEGHRSKSSDWDAEHSIVAIHNPYFSPDGTTIFFGGDGWATSPAAYALDLVSGKERFLYDGVTSEILPNGNLVAWHFRIEWNSKGESEGRQEIWTLNDPDGKELRKLPKNDAARAKAIAALRASP